MLSAVNLLRIRRSCEFTSRLWFWVPYEESHPLSTRGLQLHWCENPAKTKQLLLTTIPNLFHFLPIIPFLCFLMYPSGCGMPLTINKLEKKKTLQGDTFKFYSLSNTNSCLNYMVKAMSFNQVLSQNDDYCYYLIFSTCLSPGSGRWDCVYSLKRAKRRDDQN